MGSYHYEFFAPLDNFRSEAKSLKFSDSLEIREVNELESRKLNYNGFIINIKLSLNEAKPDDALFRLARTRVERVVTALRLFKPERVGYRLLFRRRSEEDLHSLTEYRHQFLWVPPDIGYSRETYSLDVTEAEELLAFFEQVDVKAMGRLHLAISYFGKSYIEPFTRDSFLDNMIALENLFLKGSSQEATYKLKTRMALFLADEVDKRKEIFDDIKKAYNMRSKIVHGDRKVDVDYDFLLKIRDYTRLSIRQFLKLPDLRDRLDDVILAGGRHSLTEISDI